MKLTTQELAFFDQAMLTAMSAMIQVHRIMSVDEFNKIPARAAGIALNAVNERRIKLSRIEPSDDVKLLEPDTPKNLSIDLSNQSLLTKNGLLKQAILNAVSRKKGHKLTTTQIFNEAFPEEEDKPTINELRDIGMLLRQFGFKETRSGGKDLFIL